MGASLEQAQQFVCQGFYSGEMLRSARTVAFEAGYIPFLERAYGYLGSDDLWAKEDAELAVTFGVGDRVRCKATGTVGSVVSVEWEGDPMVMFDDEPAARQRFGKDFEIIEKMIQGPSEEVMAASVAEAADVAMADQATKAGAAKARRDEQRQRIIEERRLLEAYRGCGACSDGRLLRYLGPQR